MRIALVCTHWILREDTFDLVKECWKNMDRVILLIDKEQDTRDYEKKLVPNTWFDTGKVYNWLQDNKLTEKDELCITNCTISPISDFKELFDFCKNKELDFAWATSSYTKRGMQKIVDWRHIQSFFLYIKWKAIESLQEYYESNWLIKCKRQTVETYECWLSMFMKIKGYRCKAFLEIDDMMKRYDKIRYDNDIFIWSWQKIQVYKKDGECNMTFAYPELYLEQWLPFVKNTMLKYWFTTPIIQTLASKIYNNEERQS